VSRKKVNFSRDFSSLSAWGAAKQPFFALIDFEGGLMAANADPSEFGAGYDFGGTKLYFRAGPGRITVQKSAMEFHSSLNEMAQIQSLQGRMREGLAYLVNYCSQSEVYLGKEIHELFTESQATYTIWLENEFICFSPECFVSVSGTTISTSPMKGTSFDRSGLLADAKELAEHATVVDLLRNDLGRVAKKIRIANYRYVTEIPQANRRILYQTSSRIEGEMAPNWRETIGEWLPKLLPAGSVTGAPKRETLQLIKKYESEPRGFYTGVAVWFDGENLSSAVLIRFIDLRSRPYKFRSGAGITIYSDAARENQEISDKVYIPL